MLKSTAYYIKLQDAFVAETGVYIGDWTAIGYSLPQSSTFKYDDATGWDASTAIKTQALSATPVTGWTATALVSLNSCAKDNTWKLNITLNSSVGGIAQYDALVSDMADCNVLTPNFGKLDKDGVATSS